MANKSSGASAAREAARVASRGRKSKEDRTGGGGDGAGVRRFLSFPAIIMIILLLGSALVVYARFTRDVAARPRQNEDHWHSAYGVWDCASNNGTGGFLPAFQSTDDELGIHSHQDGVIHIHPWFDAASGRNARIGVFLAAMRAEVSQEAIVLPTGQRLEAGVECNGEPSIITVRRWRDINSLDRDSVIYEEDLADVRFLAQGEAFVIARAPEGADIPTPPQAHIQATLGATPGLQSRPPVGVTTEQSENN